MLGYHRCLEHLPAADDFISIRLPDSPAAFLEEHCTAGYKS